MKKHFVMVGIILILMFQMSACDSTDFSEEISEKIGVDVSGGKEITVSDTHGGFHGDGTTYGVLEFSNNKLEEKIKNNEKWSRLPLDKGAETLAYGTGKETDDTIEISGPYMTDDKGNGLMPKVENGYYFLFNKQNGKTGMTHEEIANASSLNVILAIYDTDTQRLYFCEEDT